METNAQLLREIITRLERLENSLQRPGGPAPTGGTDMLELAMTMRRARDSVFPREYFSDAAWELLLDVYLADKERRKAAISDLGLAAGIPLTTTLRYIDRLESDGFVARVPDPHDKRRIFIALTEQGRAAMNHVGTTANQWLARRRGGYAPVFQNDTGSHAAAQNDAAPHATAQDESAIPLGSGVRVFL